VHILYIKYSADDDGARALTGMCRHRVAYILRRTTIAIEAAQVAVVYIYYYIVMTTTARALTGIVVVIVTRIVLIVRHMQ
jgi:hypothetical protein